MPNLHEDRELLEQMRGQIDEELFREKYGVTEEQAKELVDYIRETKGGGYYDVSARVRSG